MAAMNQMMREVLLDLLGAGRLDLPFPGGGETGRRFEALTGLARQDLSASRLIEAHADARAILAEAGYPAPAGLLAVWASDGPSGRVRAVLGRRGWRLDGVKQYCSGLGIVDHALVTARGPDGNLLFLVPLDRPGITFDRSGWRTDALAATATGTVAIESIQLAPSHLVGDPGFYLERPGFWHGAVGVAACWAGGAIAIAEKFHDGEREDPHTLAHAGAVEAECWSLGALLGAAAREIDEDPLNTSSRAKIRALAVRHLVERACRDVIDRAGRALGPGPLALDEEHRRRVADLTLYIRQHHAERDLEQLGRLACALTIAPAAPGHAPGQSSFTGSRCSACTPCCGTRR
jgi:alkylation response protein AidB-like acyl-CoA dehydrogenase